MESITIQESSRLIALERTIQKGVATFIDVGEALMEIRDSRLYRIEYATFEDYCKSKWDISTRQANRLIGASETVAVLGPIGPMPKTESQARPLTKLSEPEQRREAWQKAVDASPTGQPTAREVEAAVDSVMQPEPECPTHDEQPEPEPAPTPRPSGLSFGLQYASMAIMQLKKINPTDTQRVEAGQEVIRWINANLK